MDKELEKKLKDYIDNPKMIIEAGHSTAQNEGMFKQLISNKTDDLIKSINKASDSSDRLSKSLNRISWIAVVIAAIALFLEAYKLFFVN